MVTICALEVPFTSVDHCLMVVDFSNPVGLVVANAALVEEDIEVSARPECAQQKVYCRLSCTDRAHTS